MCSDIGSDYSSTSETDCCSVGEIGVICVTFILWPPSSGLFGLTALAWCTNTNFRLLFISHVSAKLTCQGLQK